MRILIVGGYGMFGSRVAERLARTSGLEVVVAGRSEASAAEQAAGLRASAKARVSHAFVDATRCDAATLLRLGAGIVINASGPFQQQDYGLARAAIAAGAHYIDLADARAFVAGIAALDGEAKRAGVLVVSGASTVPALAAAVLDTHEAMLGGITRVAYGISPGNSFDPGLATTASILSYVGQPFTTLREGAMIRVFGWQGLHRRRIAGLGRRWMGYCDVPDLDLFPVRYRRLERIDFFAGMEVGLFHLGLWGLSWLVRLGLLSRPSRLAGPLLALKRRLGFLGSDRGGMFVSSEGARGSDGRRRRIDWHLVAGSGHGPYIPAIASVIIARKLASGALAQRGAMACLGLLTVEEFSSEVADLDIRASTGTEEASCA